MTEVRTGLHRFTIPNTGIMDDPTNMYVIGRDPVWIVDPGSQAGINHVYTALQELGKPTISAIILTHVHIDHGESAGELHRHTGAPVWFHPAEVPEWKAEGLDIPLHRELHDGEEIVMGENQFEVVLTPGHARGHLSLIEVNENFGIVGDLITGWGSSAIFPPYGDLHDYIASLERIRDRGCNPLYPAHGDAVTNGPDALSKFVQRRQQREQEIVAFIEAANDPVVSDILQAIYGDVPSDLINDVTGNVQIHLDKLIADGTIERGNSNGATHYRLVAQRERDNAR